MKTAGNGFTYFFGDKKLKDFDEFEKIIKTKEVKIKIDGLKITAEDGRSRH